ncbi:hypothetical protein [Actinoplanes siamensis]|uniref:Uncharacterized protein n=1 Tax=Actinoplanes siamensis TaxID=1223317 RepID=A0A919NCF3_9ACTN|nr:hypothetical protein [Actinoplanes siamensis]GIF08652.1 hypothetical protein Asi03nite_61900 [Actinoplanes siamensis]
MTTRDPRWTDEDRDWMLALAVYRSWLCPKCGGLLEECTSHADTGPTFQVSKIRCRRTDALITEQEANTLPNPEALLWAWAAQARM